MALFVLTNVRLFIAAADLTSHSNKVELATDAEVRDSTTYGSGGWKEVKAGIFSTALAAEGFWEAGDPGKVDDDAFTNIGSVQPYTACPDGADVADVAWLSKALRYSYKLGGQVGDMAGWSATASGAWPLPRGRVLHPPGTARTTSGNGTAVEYEAASASQFVYASLHVLSVSGTATPTITVTVESDVDNTFATPTTQVSFAAATAVGGQVLRTAGPVTDTWYRATWTISGTDPSFLFLVAVGVK